MVNISLERLLGVSETGLIAKQVGSRTLLALPEAWVALELLTQDAAQHGFTLIPCSAFRSFAAQAAIVTAKFLGQRPILDKDEQPLNPIPTDPLARLQAITLFSAMPGFSRHHFGSDFDIYAPNLLPPGQALQLTYHEYLPGSYFYELGLYLQENLARFGFANPYLPPQPQLHLSQPVLAPKQPKSHLPASPQPKSHLPEQAQLQVHAGSALFLAHAAAMAAYTSTTPNKPTVGVTTTNVAMPSDATGSALAFHHAAATGASVQMGLEPWHISHLASARPLVTAWDSEAALEYVEHCDDLVFAPYIRALMTPERCQAMLQPQCC